MLINAKQAAAEADRVNGLEDALKVVLAQAEKNILEACRAGGYWTKLIVTKGPEGLFEEVVRALEKDGFFVERAAGYTFMTIYWGKKADSQRRLGSERKLAQG